MNWQRYQNELIILGTFLLMLGAYIYKHNQVTAQTMQASSTQHTINELKEVIALQKIWADKNVLKKINNLKGIVSASKVKWSKQKTEVDAKYTALSSNDLNKLTTKILNLPAEILLLDIKKIGSSYNVEFKCKW